MLSRRFLLVSMATIFFAGCGDYESGSRYAGSAENYELVELTKQEKELVISNIASVAGTPYVWGGDTVSKGFDCSGLIQWAYRRLGFGVFINGTELYTEVTAHNLYHQNSFPFTSLVTPANIEQLLERGDFIFFDENSDGRITHNSVFDFVDATGGVWVWDSYSVDNIGVTHRIVKDFWSKGPIFAKPAKVVSKL